MRAACCRSSRRTITRTAILPAIRVLSRTDPEGLAGAARLATVNPARALGLTDRGALEVGKRADLIVVDPQDRVGLTMVAGRTVYSNGTLAPVGQPLDTVA
ncbi:amidohydrolase family protein [Ponticoccus litoralis]|uniref:Amidohydrolase family protein n=1 Tax=Ponticoccus litoralis TaxID=422297 RepID=A0AAW9SG55_9RHOB